MPRDEIPMSKMSSKEKASPPGLCRGEMAGGGKYLSLHWQTQCQGRLGREGTSPQHHASFTRMMPSKADRCGLTDSGRMRDEQRCGLCSKVCGDAASNQAIAGSFTAAIAGTKWAQGHSWVPSDTKTQQGKMQLQAAGSRRGREECRLGQSRKKSHPDPEEGMVLLQVMASSALLAEIPSSTGRHLCLH